MFKNYLKISVRNLLRNKVYSLINILGLAVGLTCFILLYLYTSRELSYDQYHTHKNEVYRVVGGVAFGDKKRTLTTFSSQLAEHLQSDLPEVTQTAIINQSKSSLKRGIKEIKKPKMFYASQSLFEILNFKPTAGNLDQALSQPNTIVLTSSLAQKLFNTPRRALGETVTIRDSLTYLVTAVIEDVPENSHFKPEALISLQAWQKANPKSFQDWSMLSFTTYLKVKPSAGTQKIKTFAKKLYEKHSDFLKIDFELQALTNIHLHSKADYDYADTGDANTVYILVIVGILILLIASINYMNLATARSIERAKEVGIRKVVGSTRQQLVYQFLIESVFICVFAFVISLSLVEVLLPKFNQLTGNIHHIGYTSTPWVLGALLGVVLVVGLVSGSFPALVLSRFHPHLVLKGKFSRSQQGNRFRKALVIVQFSVSLIMIVSTLIVIEQMQYARTKDLGFDKDQLLSIPIFDKRDVFRQKLSLNSGVTQVTFGMPLARFASAEFQIEQEKGGKTPVKITFKTVGRDWMKSLGIKKLKGRYFNPDLTSDISKAIVINEAFVKKMGWKEPIGKTMEYRGAERKMITARVVGVVQDFHSESLYEKIHPMLFFQRPDDDWAHQAAFVRVKAENLPQTLAYVKQTYQSLYPKTEYQGKFMDQQFAEAYRADQKRAEVFTLFSGIAIFIACIGLFGLASFTVSQRSKEIGIRKVLGASITQILALLSGGFARLIVFSSFIAFPIAYYLMSQWLQNFAYRTTIHWSIFALAGGATLGITLAVISIQSLRTARLNPVHVLKDE